MEPAKATRVALALARTRLMAAKYPYYVLADSPEGAKREAELTGVPPADSAFSGRRSRGSSMGPPGSDRPTGRSWT